MILGKVPPAKLPLDGRQPQNFPEWLEVATWDLIPSAQARVRPEIEAHYAEALQSHRVRGVSEAEAAAAALADLGGAKVAAKRFRQEYLTTAEINVLRKQITDARDSTPTISQLAILFCGFMTSLMSLIAWGFGAFTNMRHFYFFTAPMLLMYLVFASLDLVAIILARRKSTMAIARQFSLLGTIKKLNMLVMIIILATYMLTENDPGAFGNSSHFSLFIKAFFVGSIVVNLMTTVSEGREDSHLRKKLAAAHEDDLPPSGPASA